MLNSPVDEIKNKLDLVDVVQGYIKLQKTGVNFRARCPFHSEKTPSFFVSPTRQSWKCFGCGAGGDVFKFIMQIEGIEFGDALRTLAQKAGVTLQYQDPQVRTERQRFYEICEIAAQFFEKQLQASTMGKKAKDYLLGRKINDEAIKEFRLGYAPDEWRALSDFLVGKGYTREEVSKAGLAIKKESISNQQSAISNYYDRFRGRIIFPVFDIQGQVIGFGGRVAPWREHKKHPTVDNQQSAISNRQSANEELPKDFDEPKYLNTPQTMIYDKSKVLYGLDKAKVEIRKNNFCIMMEGYTDVILSWQYGIKNVVSSSGTALTSWQLKILKRYTENLYTAYDMDLAGDTATKRGIDLAQAQGFQIKVITLQEGKDPADVITENPAVWENDLKEAKSILQYYFDTTLQKFDKGTVEGKREIAKIILPVIRRIPNKIEQAHWLGELSRAIGIDEKFVYEELHKLPPEQFLAQDPDESPVPALAQELPRTRQRLLEERLLALLSQHPEYIELVKNEITVFSSPEHLEIFNAFSLHEDFSGANGEVILASVANNLSEGSRKVFDEVILRSEFEEAKPEKKELDEEFKTCVKELKGFLLREKLKELSTVLAKAEMDHNAEEVGRLSREFAEISKQLI